MSDINWTLGQPRESDNFLTNFLKGEELGEARRTKAATRNALASYGTNPDGAINALMAVDPQKAKLLSDFRTANEQRAGRGNAMNLLAGGDRSGAVRAALGTGNPNLAKGIMDFSKEEVAQSKALHEMGGSLLFSALELPPNERAAYVATNRPPELAHVLTDERIQGLNWADDRTVRAHATQAMDVAKQMSSHLAEERFAFDRQDKTSDNQRANAMLGLSTNRFEEDRRHNRVSEGQTNARIGYEGARVESERDRLGMQSQAPAQIVGAILEKVQSGQPLTAQDRQALDLYKSTVRSDSMFGMGGDAAGEPYGAPVTPSQRAPNSSAPRPPRTDLPALATGRTPRQAPAPARRGGNGVGPESAARVNSAADFERLPVGAFFINPADGRVLQKKH